jgi:predicted nucleic acid-binding protein
MIDVEHVVNHAVDTDSVIVLVRQSLATARSFQLSFYDAVYLDLARRERLPLATLDHRLRAAAARAGVELVRCRGANTRLLETRNGSTGKEAAI